MQDLGVVSPLYTVYYYTDFLYRIVRFKSAARLSPGEMIPPGDSDSRLSQSYSRSRRMVLQCALCNRWDYFITITVSPVLFDRYDLETIYSALYLFFKSYRQVFSPGFCWLLVPEYHKDGAWHFHGLISGVVPSHLSEFVPGIHPQKLIDQGYVNWGMLAGFVGYVSLSKVVSPVGCGFYLAKYITKEHANDDFYKHLYFHSQGLRTAYPISDCYVPSLQLDSFLTQDYEFCSCGWAELANPDFTFPFSFGCEPRELDESFFTDALADSLEVMPPSVSQEAPFEPVQLSLSDMPPVEHWQLRPPVARKRV